jgi:uncharacterized membrane protein
MKMTKNDTAKICAVLLYVFPIVGIIWYLVDEDMKKNLFAKYHLKQALMLFIVGLIFSAVYTVIYIILSVITLGIFALIGWIGYFLPFIWVIQGLIYSIKEEKKPLWVIGDFALKTFKF